MSPSALVLFTQYYIMETHLCWCVQLKFIHSLLLCNVLLCEYMMISFSFCEGHVGCDPLFAITKHATRNILELVSLYTFGGLCLGSGSQSGLLKPAAAAAAPDNLLEMQIHCSPPPPPRSTQSAHEWMGASGGMGEWMNQDTTSAREDLLREQQEKDINRKSQRQITQLKNGQMIWADMSSEKIYQ